MQRSRLSRGCWRPSGPGAAVSGGLSPTLGSGIPVLFQVLCGLVQEVLEPGEPQAQAPGRFWSCGAAAAGQKQEQSWALQELMLRFGPWVLTRVIPSLHRHRSATKPNSRSEVCCSSLPLLLIFLAWS